MANTKSFTFIDRSDKSTTRHVLGVNARVTNVQLFAFLIIHSYISLVLLSTVRPYSSLSQHLPLLTGITRPH